MRGEKGTSFGKERGEREARVSKKEEKKKKWQRYDIPSRHKGKILTRIRV